MRVEDFGIEFWWQRIGCVRNPGAQGGEEVARDNEIADLRKALQEALDASKLDEDELATITEAAQVLASAAKYNREKGRTVFAETQQDRADRLNAIIRKEQK